jgi:hypothetical protein
MRKSVVRPPILIGGAVALSYLALGCLVYWPVSPLSGHTIIDVASSDPVQELWFLHWTAWALLHAHNPLFTYYLHAPQGANLAVNTTFPLLGALGAPITWAAGPLVTYNVLLRLALASSAFAMYLVLRRYTRWWPAAYAGGLLFGFSPYMIGHAHRHLFLTFLPLLPLFLPVLDDWLVSRRRNPYLGGLFLGLLIAGEFLISPEIAVLAIAWSVLGLLVLALRHRREVRERLLPLAKGCLAAAGPVLVVIGYPAYLLLAGPQRPAGPIHALSNLDNFHGDLLAPVVPTAGEHFAPSGSGAGFGGSVVENGFYLGIPLLLLLLVATIRFRRSSLVVAAAVVAVVAFVLSLGRTLTVGGHTVLAHMPFALIVRIPVLQNIEPARLSLFVQLPAAIILAVALDRWRREGWRRPRDPTRSPRPGMRATVVTAVGVLALLPLLPQLPLRTAPVHVPAFFTDGGSDAIPQGALAFTYPYSRTPADDAMLWQSASGMRFRTFGGRAFVPGPLQHRSTDVEPPPSPPDIRPVLVAARRPVGRPWHPPRTLPVRLRNFLDRYRVQVVLVDEAWRRSAVITRLLTEAIGRAPVRHGGMAVWLNVRSRRA